MPPAGPTYLQIVHDEYLTCAGCAAVLGSRPDVVVSIGSLGGAVALMAGEGAASGAAHGGAHATASVPDRCDLVIADHTSALALALTARQAARRHAGRGGGRCPRILVLTALDREWDLRVALEAGVQGYQLQRCQPEQLIEAVDAVMRGVQYVSPDLVPKLARCLTQDRLTRREMDVLLAMSTGASNKDISQRLGITDATVKTHVRAILSKVGAGARTEAVAIAARSGLTSRPPHFAGQKAPVLIQASTSAPN